MNSAFFNRIFFVLLLPLVTFYTGCGEDDTQPTPDLPKISIGSVTLTEGNDEQQFNFQVLASAAYDQAITVDYQTEDGTAVAGTDFAFSAGTITIPAGERQGTITIDIITDIYREQDEEFSVVLSNAKNAVIQTGTGIGTIRNDDTFVDIPEDGYITPESYGGYDLVWRDEFNGTSINTNDWTFEMGNSGWGNNEWQYYTDRSENAYLSDGSLVIEAREEAFGGADYTSARMITLNKQSFTFGRIDIRAILPEGQGIWPALWMLGTNITDIGWPACGEIDIMELVGHEPSTVHGTIHWGPQGQGYSNFTGGSYSLAGEKFSEQYHVFSILWEPGSIQWLVDDNEFFSINTNTVNGNYPFNDDFFFIFNIAVGGNWPGYPDASTVFPQRIYVDYIRVFQES
ncbi:MAG: family 16 glycosylhydrolase [Bacteroidota bacterium]